MKLLAEARASTADEAILRPAALELSRLLDLIGVLARHIDARYRATLAKRRSPLANAA